ncbi:hypothetical protein CDL15_Pgr012392 [Punica granatum]|uniref:Uncharacterized protein n=1 Tax=Punica granatum TaxID=22663 RepID=A0A218W3B3_PUNGR|nr:hypothetical protein CDL15_Pgr012392 [Punica granatum]
MAWMGSWSVELKHLDILQKEDKGKLSSWLEEEDDKRGVVLLVFGKGKKVPWVPHGIGGESGMLGCRSIKCSSSVT